MEKDYPDCFECLNLMDEDYPKCMECFECKEKRKRERLRREKALKRPFLQDMKKDSDLESLKMDLQKCRENRERLMRQKALQRGFLEQEPQKRIGVGYDEEKERIARFHIGNIVALEWEKLEMEKKQRMEQIGVGHEEEEPRKSETFLRFEDSNNSKIGVQDSEGKRRRWMENGLDMICFLLDDDLEIQWKEKMEKIGVGLAEQKPQSLNQNQIGNDEEEEPCTLNGGDILADLKEMGEMNSERKPSTQIEEEKPRRSNTRRRRLEIEISDDEELEPSNDAEFVPWNSEDKKSKKKKKVNNNDTKKKKQKAVALRVEVAPRIEVGPRVEAAPRLEVVVARRVEVREGDDPPPDLPENFEARIREMNGNYMILVLQKQLFKTDIETGENRLSIPLNQIRREFLTEEEKVRVVEGMKVVLLQPSLEESIVTFKKWKMKPNCHLYVFTKEWKFVVKDNSLEAGNVVQVWSFRVGSELRFALVRVNQ